MLAQQIVAARAGASRPVARRSPPSCAARSANFAELSDELLATPSTCSPAATRQRGVRRAAPAPRVGPRQRHASAPATARKRLAVTSGGTIPDRGLFGVFLPDGTRVGELDEEMVYESRPGETFVLGASTWRIEDITFERVTVTPAPGEPGKMPFWHGDRPGRPLELGRALGAFVRELRGARRGRRRSTACASDYAPRRVRRAATSLQYLDEQAEATGVVPDDRTIVVERFRDEIGDWRVCVLSPFGTPVHAPWAMAIERRLADRYDMPVESMWGDDGIVLRLPEAADELPARRRSMIDPEDIEELVVATLPQTALFSSRFRECAGARAAAAAPPSRPAHAAVAAAPAAPPTCWPWPPSTRRSRSCSRRRASACRTCSTCRRCATCSASCAARAVRMVTVDTPKPSPMAQSLLFNWIAAYMYEGDAPLAERRAAALGPRPRPAARPARRRGAARAARPRGARRRRARPAAALRRAPGPHAPTSCTTCCGESAT